MISQLWMDVLGTPVTPGSDFFDLGGHSVLIIELTSRLNELLRASVPLDLVFDYPRLSDFCRAVYTLVSDGE